MPTNDGTGQGWVTTEPADDDPIGPGAREIRDLRIGTAARLAKEHVAPGNSSVGGEHLQGSAKVYFTDASPALRPDGVTALDITDQGRLLVKSNSELFYYRSDLGWVPVIAASIPDGIVTAQKIAACAVELAALSDGVFTADDTAVTGGRAKFAPGFVTSALIADGTIVTGDIADAAVTTAKIADAAITAAKLASGVGGHTKVSSYTGNGTTTNAVSGIGFTPKFIIISKHGSAAIAYGFIDFGTSPTLIRVNGGSDVASPAIAWDADGFTLKSNDTQINANGTVYSFAAFG